LVLWCLAKSAPTLSIFLSCDDFAINVLSSKQRILSNQFARPAADKFSDVKWSAGFGGAPVLTDSLAIFECRNARQYEEGDHWIIIGEVQQFSYGDDEPLIFAGGKYAIPTHHPDDHKIHDNKDSPNLTL
ncbi:flavin reductase family protein, partial [Pseudomonadota bacterium]